MNKKFAKSARGQTFIKSLFSERDYTSIYVGTYLAKYYLQKDEAIELISSIKFKALANDKYIKRTISSLKKNKK